jgi:hypothetical protein
LSPLKFSGLLARQADIVHMPGSPTYRRMVEQVTLYRCPECRELHDDEDDALECCFETSAAAASSSCCPVCADKAPDHYAAAECCLWKDMALPERWRVATAVRGGATWAEALGLDPGITGHWAKAGLGVRRLS